MDRFHYSLNKKLKVKNSIHFSLRKRKWKLIDLCVSKLKKESDSVHTKSETEMFNVAQKEI